VERYEPVSGDARIILPSSDSLGLYSTAYAADVVYIHLVTEAAAAISQLFTKALQSGRLTEDALFDTNYQPIPGTDPVQYMTGFTSLTDEVLPEIQEAILVADPNIVFCATADRNGYIPTHNRHCSQPQRPGDREWNATNCRNRRIFNDRVGMRAGLNTEPTLFQSYLREMGGGKTILMQDVSSPITVNGRHWGCLRLAYKPLGSE